MSNSEWQEAARRIREAERATQHARAAEMEKAKSAAKERADIHKKGMSHIQMVVDQFLKAMKKAHNPGRSGIVRGNWESHHQGKGLSTTLIVHSNGRWVYRSSTPWIIGAGPGGDVYGSSSESTSEDPVPTYDLSVEHYYALAEAIREHLIDILNQYKVPLPPD